MQLGSHPIQDDIDFLTKNTKYDETEIKEWYKGFKVRANTNAIDKFLGNISTLCFNSIKLVGTFIVG